jgi:hypothetical protein
MLTQSSHFPSELSFVLQTTKIVRSKAKGQKQNSSVENLQEMTALEMRLELLIAQVKAHLQSGLSIRDITHNLEEEIFQVRLLLYAENLDISMNDVEGSLSAYNPEPAWADLIESIEFACRVSFRIANEHPDFIQQFLLLQGIDDAEQVGAIVADGIEQIQTLSYRYFRHTLQENHIGRLLSELSDTAFLLDVQLIHAVLVLEKEITLNSLEVRFLCNAINDTTQTLGSHWRKIKRLVQPERHVTIEKEEVLFAVPFDFELAEQGIAEYAELLVAEEDV